MHAQNNLIFKANIEILPLFGYQYSVIFFRIDFFTKV